jgi:exopolyphosphatase/guanosine-5'-triphosphate,3'-diphosphate pyrophosphatase
MQLLASIDVGSNTIRLLISGTEDNRIIDVFSDRKITRLGDRVDQTGRLQDKNIEVSIAALKEFSSAISKYGVRHVKAVATSALREASNSDIFIK